MIIVGKICIKITNLKDSGQKTGARLACSPLRFGRRANEVN